MPAFKNHTGYAGVPRASGGMGGGSGCRACGIPVVRGYRSGDNQVFEERNYVIAGVSRDSAGAALGVCTMTLFRNDGGVLTQEQTTTSDASGNYSFVVDKTRSYRVVCDKTGPVVAGISGSLAGA